MLSVFIYQAVATDKGKKMQLKTTMTFKERVLKAVCKSHGPVVSTRNLQRQLKGALSDTVRGMFYATLTSKEKHICILIIFVRRPTF